MSLDVATPQIVHDVTIRLAGDSGDGMQLTGDRFTALAALAGNDLATLPDFCLLYTSDAADERSSVDLGGRRIIKKKNKHIAKRRNVL